MITSDTITEQEILLALKAKGESLQHVREKFNANLESNSKETIKIAQNVAMRILDDLDSFLDAHSQV